MKHLMLIFSTVLLTACAAMGNTGPVRIDCQGPAFTVLPGNPDYERLRELMFASVGLALPEGEGGPIVVGGASFQLSLPLGSGREYLEGIRTLEDHACGQIDIPSIEQGEDRSPGLFGLAKDFFIG